MLAIVAVVAVIGTPVGLAIAAAVSAPDAPPAQPDEIDGLGDAGRPENPSPGSGAAAEDRPPGSGAAAEDRPPGSGAAAEADAEAPDADRLSGRDATWAALLRDVDHSERVMLAFQRELAGIAAAGPDHDRGQLLARVRAVAAEGVEALALVRPRLAASVGDGRVEEVRTLYLAHHDAWADYLDAVVEEPGLVGRQDIDAVWRLSIETSGRAFARQLRDAVGPQEDPAVRAYARDILRRGFGDPAGVVGT